MAFASQLLFESKPVAPGSVLNLEKKEPEKKDVNNPSEPVQEFVSGNKRYVLTTQTTCCIVEDNNSVKLMDWKNSPIKEIVQMMENLFCEMEIEQWHILDELLEQIAGQRAEFCREFLNKSANMVVGKLIKNFNRDCKNIQDLAQLFVFCSTRCSLYWFGEALRDHVEHFGIIKKPEDLAVLVSSLPPDARYLAMKLLDLYQDKIPADKNGLKVKAYAELLHCCILKEIPSPFTATLQNILNALVLITTKRNNIQVQIYEKLLIILFSPDLDWAKKSRSVRVGEYLTEVYLGIRITHNGAGSRLGNALQEILEKGFNIKLPKNLEKLDHLVSTRDEEAKLDYPREIAALQQRLKNDFALSLEFKRDAPGKNMFYKILNQIVCVMQQAMEKNTVKFSFLHPLEAKKLREKIQAFRNLLKEYQIFVPENYGGAFYLRDVAEFDSTKDPFAKLRSGKK